MQHISKEAAAAIMGCSVRTFEKLYSSKLTDVGLGGPKVYHQPEVEALKQKLIDGRLNQNNGN